MPQWNADAFSHNALCSLFNRFGVSALRLSKPYHDIRRPAELERSDYAVSANIGRTIAACRQAVIDIRCCIDWLEAAGLRAVRHPRHQPRLLLRLYRRRARQPPAGQRLQSCLHVLRRRRLDRPEHPPHPRSLRGMPDLSKRLRECLGSHQPRPTTWTQFAAHPKKVLLVHATYDLTFLPRILTPGNRQLFRRRGIDFVSKVLPCGHYTTGETPYKFIDGWYIGSFIYSAFKHLATLPAVPAPDTELLAR